MPEGRPRVLLAGHADWFGIARLPQVLARAGCRVTVFAPRGHHVMRTRFADSRVAAPEHLHAFIEALASHLDGTPAAYAWVVFGDDEVVEAAAARREQAWARRGLPVRDADAAGVLESKTAFLRWLRHEGLPVPRWGLASRTDEALAAAREVGFPLVLKRETGWGGLGVRLASDAKRAREAFDELSGNGPLIVQESVPGRVGLAVCLFDRGRLRCSMVAYKERTFPGPFGGSSALRLARIDGLAEILTHVGEGLDYHGFAGLDFVHDEESGRLWLLELNARPTPQVHVGARVGADFSEAVRGMLAGDPVPALVPAGEPGRLVPLFPADVLRAADDRDVRGLLAWCMHPSWWADVPWADPGLLAHVPVAALGKALRRSPRAERGRL